MHAMIKVRLLYLLCVLNAALQFIELLFHGLLLSRLLRLTPRLFLQGVLQGLQLSLVVLPTYTYRVLVYQWIKISIVYGRNYKMHKRHSNPPLLFQRQPTCIYLNNHVHRALQMCLGEHNISHIHVSTSWYQPLPLSRQPSSPSPA